MGKMEQMRQGDSVKIGKEEGIVWSTVVVTTVAVVVAYLYFTGSLGGGRFVGDVVSRDVFPGKSLVLTCEEPASLSIADRASRDRRLGEILKMVGLTQEKLKSLLPENCYASLGGESIVFSGKDLELTCNESSSLSVGSQAERDQRLSEIITKSSLTREELEEILPLGCYASLGEELIGVVGQNLGNCSYSSNLSAQEVADIQNRLREIFAMEGLSEGELKALISQVCPPDQQISN